MKNVVVLGCTGSIGETTFRVLENLGDGFRVVGLSAGRQVGRLVEAALRWRPRAVCVGSPALVREAEAALSGVRVLSGEEGLEELAVMEEADVVVNGLVGAVGLKPTLAALRAGKVVAMANKEPIVMAGGILLDEARSCGGSLLPLDSEPNALWQCMKGEDQRDVKRLILTASGGPFFGWSKEQMRSITPEQALNHPTWRMGPKITVDSATLMNKGFEVIEAGWLFGVDMERIDVLVHRQSVVHSMVEFVDGAILAHLGKTDMALPIQYALTHPRRVPSHLDGLSLERLDGLSFASPDRENFPCLELAYQAARAGGIAPAALSAADEVAVSAFLEERIGFLDIFEVNRHVLNQCRGKEIGGIEELLEADRWARKEAEAWIAGRGERK